MARMVGFSTSAVSGRPLRVSGVLGVLGVGGPVARMVGRRARVVLRRRIHVI